MAALLAAAPVLAQERPAARPFDLAELRHHIYVMEGALARAVDFGAQKLNKEIRAVMPDVFMLAGEAQARGVYLDGYGVFFDVEVPMLRQSMMWSLRMMLDQDDQAMEGDIANLRRSLQGITDPAIRASIEASIRRLEQQVASTGAMPRSGREPQARDSQVGATVALPGGPVPAASGAPVVAARPGPSTEKAWIKDPNRAYTEAVQRALVDAMIDYSAPMVLGPDDWLTVGARDNERRDSLAPQDPYEEVVTVLLRIKGSDLLAYRTGKIDRDEARRRVQVGEF